MRPSPPDNSSQDKTRAATAVAGMRQRGTPRAQTSPAACSVWLQYLGEDVQVAACALSLAPPSPYVFSSALGTVRRRSSLYGGAPSNAPAVLADRGLCATPPFPAAVDARDALRFTTGTAEHSGKPALTRAVHSPAAHTRAAHTPDVDAPAVHTPPVHTPAVLRYAVDSAGPATVGPGSTTPGVEGTQALAGTQDLAASSAAASSKTRCGSSPPRIAATTLSLHNPQMHVLSNLDGPLDCGGVPLQCGGWSRACASPLAALIGI